MFLYQNNPQLKKFPFPFAHYLLLHSFSKKKNIKLNYRRTR